ncbi:MAG TPA: hypothetical protein PLM75_12375, partial [bacterium]|nr:hypothetical protein [bacterium]
MVRNKIRKIIFLYSSIFCERDYKRFGIDILKQNDFKVEVWELSPIIFPKVYLNNLSSGKIFERDCYKIFE